MKKYIIKLMLLVTLTINNQYFNTDKELLVDFTLNDHIYTGVYYEDMFDMLNDACLSDHENKLK